jgi:hypothetical protein
VNRLENHTLHKHKGSHEYAVSFAGRQVELLGKLTASAVFTIPFSTLTVVLAISPTAFFMIRHLLINLLVDWDISDFTRQVEPMYPPLWPSPASFFKAGQTTG